MDLFNPNKLPIEIIMTALAIFGGVARYLNGYINGQGFKLSLFISSIVVSGFGGLMFGLLGLALDAPMYMLLVMAGLGGHFSDQTLKFIYELVKNKVK